jgi:hypothetical protein
MPKGELVSAPAANAMAGSIDTSVDGFSQGLTVYLDELGLPSKDVLVRPAERLRVLQNMAAVTDALSDDQLGRAYYISKFVAACGAGLFDAALNFLWNETVSSLRDKVARFDLEYFLDSTLSDPKRRASMRTADDLDKLEDWELVRGCLETGILTDIGFKHLDYIRNMRNYASAAHPNQNTLTGLQVVSWLETCIREVLSKEPQAGAIEVKKLLSSLRNEVLGASDVVPIAESLDRVPIDLVRALFRAVFGMFTDPKTAADTRNNIVLIAKPLWDVSDDQTRFEAGVKHETFAVNGEVARRSLAHQFLESAGGLAYLPNDALAAEVQAALSDLSQAHSGFNNFYNEPSPAKALLRLVPANGRVPASVEADYVKVLLMCRIGNGYGVSTAAQPTYDELISRWSERHVKVMLRLLLEDRELGSRLQFDHCAANLKTVAKELEDRIPSARLRGALSILTRSTSDQLGRLSSRSAFKAAVEAAS